MSKLFSNIKDRYIDSFDGQYRFLSNFYPVTIVYRGLEYPSVENAYQSAKCLQEEDRKLFQDIKPGKAKRLGRKVDIRPDWEECKVNIMYQLIKQKFYDEELRSKLLSTEGYTLIEGNTWNDTFWGVCNGVGENHLGEILMQVRTYYQSMITIYETSK